METKIEKLTNEVNDVANDVLAGRVELAKAKQYFNGKGKVLGAIKVQQVQLALQLAFKSHGEKLPTIPFLGGQKCLPS